jgi:Icc-related predicted phosphoesterase
MRILALSDTHGYLPELDLAGVDCVVHAGDVCPLTNHDSYYQKRWLEGKFSGWVESLEIPVYLALGNHDFAEKFLAPPNLFYGVNEIIGDVFLFGWTRTLCGWAREASEKDLKDKINNTMEEAGKAPSIWVSHGPPHGVLDYTTGNIHVGSLALSETILRWGPRLVICGHIHEAAGKDSLGDSQIYNVSLVDESYFLRNKPVVIDV